MNAGACILPRVLLLAALLAAGSLRGAEVPNVPARANADAAHGYKNVGVEEFDKLRGDKQNQVLDVRTAREFAAGHIRGAINIDINKPDFDAKVAALEKDKTYLVHCAAGVRSTRACGRLSQLKFPRLYNLEGGLRAWETAGKPVEK